MSDIEPPPDTSWTKTAHVREKETDRQIITRLSLDTIVRLTEERDRAREECGFEKGLRQSQRVELDQWITRVSDARTVLLATGRWTEDELGYDIAARITELVAVLPALVPVPCPKCVAARSDAGR